MSLKMWHSKTCSTGFSFLSDWSRMQTKWPFSDADLSNLIRQFRQIWSYSISSWSFGTCDNFSKNFWLNTLKLWMKWIETHLMRLSIKIGKTRMFQCNVSCGPGQQTRRVTCVSWRGKLLDLKRCSETEKPAVSIKCNNGQCPPPRWVTGSWGEVRKRFFSPTHFSNG